MDLHSLISTTRSCRRFQQDQKISKEQLGELIELARIGGSARNCQPWQYSIITDDDTCADVFPFLGWAGYLKDWKGPVEGERPAAYILCLLNSDWCKGSEKEAYFDLGIASQNLLLGAAEKNILGCRIGAFSPKIKELFVLDDQLSIELVIALGYPAEEIILDSIADNNVAYWRDENQVHHVPKRSLSDILIELKRK